MPPPTYITEPLPDYDWATWLVVGVTALIILIGMWIYRLRNPLGPDGLKPPVRSDWED